jgi:hypothetical protein
MHPEVKRRSIWCNTTAANDCVGVSKVQVAYDGFKLSSQWKTPTILIEQLLPLEIFLIGKLDIDSQQHINQFSILHGTKHIVGLELVNWNLIQLSNAASYITGSQEPLADGRP